MKTAEEYIKNNIQLFDCDEHMKYSIGLVINHARKETIEECAKAAKWTKRKTNEESILSLIKELS